MAQIQDAGKPNQRRSSDWKIDVRRENFEMAPGLCSALECILSPSQMRLSMRRKMRERKKDQVALLLEMTCKFVVVVAKAGVAMPTRVVDRCEIVEARVEA